MFAISKKCDIYYDRGQVSIADFTIADLTVRDTYAIIDLTNIIPKNTKRILLRIDCQETTGNKQFRFRNIYVENMFNMLKYRPATNTLIHFVSGTLVPSPTCKISYFIETGTWTILNVTVCGWWL